MVKCDKKQMLKKYDLRNINNGEKINRLFILIKMARLAYFDPRFFFCLAVDISQKLQKS